MYIENKVFKKYISYWLASMFWIVSIMIIVGGLTRLTDSGLSITKWQLFTGVLPPLNNNQWNEYFELYKEIPEFKLQNYLMSLKEFKVIFWWEFIHRFLGRLIGIFFILPLIFFSIKFNPLTSILTGGQCTGSKQNRVPQQTLLHGKGTAPSRILDESHRRRQDPYLLCHPCGQQLKFLYANIAPANLLAGTPLVLVLAMHLQSNETRSVHRITQHHRELAVDPRLDFIALGLNAKVVPLFRLEGISRQFVF